MKKFILPLVSVFFILSTYFSQAQSGTIDSSLRIPMIYASYAYQWPGGDLKERFGSNSNIGGGGILKFKSNWMLGLDYNYIFGNEIKCEDSLFTSIDNEDGYFIDRNGELASVNLWERGFYTSVKFGKLFPVLSPNPNSGPFILGSVGLFQHKIRIEVPGNTVPQLAGDYAKGYDKLSNGLGISEFVGYMYMGNNRLVSFFGGIEFTQAFTQSRRDYDFNLGARDTQKRTDLLWGFRVGWIIPFYKRVPQGYYFN